MQVIDCKAFKGLREANERSAHCEAEIFKFMMQMAQKAGPSWRMAENLRKRGWDLGTIEEIFSSMESGCDSFIRSMNEGLIALKEDVANEKER